MRRKDVSKISAIVLIVAASLVAGYSACYAALGVQPENIELIVSPGTATNGVYSVFNESSEKVHVTVQPEAWPRSAQGKNDIPVEKWLTVTPMEFDMDPQERKDVQFTINPPAGHGGELSAMVFFATSSLEGAMTITTRNGVSIYAAFADAMQLKCSITDIKVSRFQQKAEDGMTDRGIVFTINFENGGNVHLRPTGLITITGQDGSKYDVNIERGFPAYVGGKGTYQTLWDKKDILPGRYDALILFDYGKIYNQDKKLEKKISFTVNKDRSVSF